MNDLLNTIAQAVVMTSKILVFSDIRSSEITSAITEPEPAIIHFNNTRKSGFACIALLSGVCHGSRSDLTTLPVRIWYSSIPLLCEVCEVTTARCRRPRTSIIAGSSRFSSSAIKYSPFVSLSKSERLSRFLSQLYHWFVLRRLPE